MRMLELRALVEAATCTVEELREYCALAFEDRPGMIKQEPVHFIPDDAMLAFNWLKGWWRLDNYPQALPSPTLLAFLWGIYIREWDPPCTINDKVLDFHRRARAYCEQNGLNPDQPGESPEERRRRKNRERMAEVRGHRKVPDKAIKDDTVREQVRELEAQIETIKTLSQAEDEMHRQDVVMHQQKMIEAANERKAAAARHKEAIEKLRSDIKNLTAKQ